MSEFLKKNLIEIVTGFLVLLSASWFFIFAITKTDLAPRFSEGDFLLTANFNSVDGLKVGSSVMLAGIKVGYVNSINLNREMFSAETVLMLNKNFALPDDTEAIINTDGIFGEKYVSLNPGGSPILLDSGDEIMFTQSSINIINLLNKFTNNQ